MEPATKFRDLRDSTAEDWKIILDQLKPYKTTLPDRIMAHLRILDGDYGGFPVDRLTHCLQTATRALRDGKEDEYVVCALLHDIGDTLGSYNHPDIAAAILRPFVSEQNLAMVEKHGEFQGHYFFHHIGLDPNMREKYAAEPFYRPTIEFCEKYDATSFDPEYDSLPLEFFEPMLRRVLATPKRSVYKSLYHKEK